MSFHNQIQFSQAIKDSVNTDQAIEVFVQSVNRDGTANILVEGSLIPRVPSRIRPIIGQALAIKTGNFYILV